MTDSTICKIIVGKQREKIRQASGVFNMGVQRPRDLVRVCGVREGTCVCVWGEGSLHVGVRGSDVCMTRFVAVQFSSCGT